MLTALLAATVVAATYPLPRHFVYGFTMNTGVAAQPAGGAKTDAGSIVVDVVKVLDDTGTLVRVSEQSPARASQPASTCVAYGTGLVQCDPIDTISVEEMCLLRVLGRNFLNWSEIDKQRAWHTGASDGRARESNDYRITGQTNGLFQIAFERVLHVDGSDGYVSMTQGRISYDDARAVPAFLTQQTVTRPQSGDRPAVLEQLTLSLRDGGAPSTRTS